MLIFLLLYCIRINQSDEVSVVRYNVWLMIAVFITILQKLFDDCKYSVNTIHFTIISIFDIIHFTNLATFTQKRIHV